MSTCAHALPKFWQTPILKDDLPAIFFWGGVIGISASFVFMPVTIFMCITEPTIVFKHVVWVYIIIHLFSNMCAFLLAVAFDGEHFSEPGWFSTEDFRQMTLLALCFNSVSATVVTPLLLIYGGFTIWGEELRRR